VIDIDGAYDLHVHSAPDLFPRIADDRQMVADAAAKGFAGVVMKNHFEGTVSRAKLATPEAGRLKVYGSLVLNRYVGGVNPYAVEAALRLGARIIWMPTLDAACHRHAFGFGGGFAAQSSGLETRQGPRPRARAGARARAAARARGVRLLLHHAPVAVHRCRHHRPLHQDDRRRAVPHLV